MIDLPTPRLTCRGNYHPVDLVIFLRSCRDRSVPHLYIAQRLQVPIDRVHYALNDGWPLFKRKADHYARVNGAAA